MPEYIYIDKNDHRQTMTLPMTYGTAVICTTCGLEMWRKPQAAAITWGGLKPSQGQIHPDIQHMIDDAPRRREEYTP
jgi:hypothetical protein